MAAHLQAMFNSVFGGNSVYLLLAYLTFLAIPFVLYNLVGKDEEEPEDRSKASLFRRVTSSFMNFFL